MIWASLARNRRPPHTPLGSYTKLRDGTLDNKFEKPIYPSVLIAHRSLSLPIATAVAH